MNRALIIKQMWLDLILCGAKTWELRGSNTKIRGKIGLIEAKSGTIVGECELIGTHRLLYYDLPNTFKKHGVSIIKDDITYKKIYAWKLKNAKRYDKPIPYKHPQGAVIWVKL